MRGLLRVVCAVGVIGVWGVTGGCLFTAGGDEEPDESGGADVARDVVADGGEVDASDVDSGQNPSLSIVPGEPPPMYPNSHQPFSVELQNITAGECGGVTWGVEHSAMQDTTTFLVKEDSEALLAAKESIPVSGSATVSATCKDATASDRVTVSVEPFPSVLTETEEEPNPALWLAPWTIGTTEDLPVDETLIWLDRSGNERHYTPVGDNFEDGDNDQIDNVPTKGQLEPLQRTTLAFDGVDDTLVSGVLSAEDGGTIGSEVQSPAWTVFVLFEPQKRAALAQLLSTSKSATQTEKSQFRHYIFPDDAEQSSYFEWILGQGASVKVDLQQDFLDQNEWALVGASLDILQGSANVYGPSGQRVGAVNGNGSSQFFGIGQLARRGNVMNQNQFEGLLAEVIVFDQVLGQEDRRAVMDYLRARYERLRASSDE